MTSDSTPKKRRRRSIDVKELYETAARCFNEHGFHGTSLADLATRLGVTKAALYHYVDNKQDLLYRLHMLSLQAARNAVERAKQEGRTGLEKVRLVTYYYVAAITESQTACMILIEDGALRPEQAEEIITESRALEHGLRDLIAEGIADGSIIPCDPKLATFVLVGSMHWATKWFRPDKEWSGHQLADGISAMIARGLSSSPAPSLPADITRPALTPFTAPAASEANKP
jgi:TetR/AcrR family transcriptional regulator